MAAQLKSETSLTPKPNQNHFLAALNPDVQNRLFQHLELVHLPLHTLVHESCRQMTHVYFPINSIILLQSQLTDGASTGIAMVGNEGLLGINLVMGVESNLYQSQVISAGYAYRLPKKQVLEEFEQFGQFSSLFFRYIQSHISQVTHNATCNRFHPIEQLFCRWILLYLDRLEHENVTMTHEFISYMLGVRRESVSQIAYKLQQQGVITNPRGLIRVLDRSKLENMSCECYRLIKNESDSLLDYLPGNKPIHNCLKAISKKTA